MRLICCGTGAGAFTAERASSGYVLEAGGHSVMLDCGAGSLRNAMRAGVAPEKIEAVIISHLHFDHMLDMADFAFLFGYNRHWTRPPVYGPPGLHEITDRIATLETPGRVALSLAEVIEIEGGDRREIAGFEVWSEETPHARGSKSFSRRLTAEGKTLVFSGDTGPNPALFARLARDADLLLHECYSLPGLERYCADRPPEHGARVRESITASHCEVTAAAQVARDAGVKRLVLTHLLRTEDPAELIKAASAVYPGEVVIAADGLVIEV